ncbi:hypothetical protein CDIK_4444 [Cucumispora dikerogammari]|nr:hypothetical protein CDIK_4444 [Cucumispora dikerogammari]
MKNLSFGRKKIDLEIKILNGEVKPDYINFHYKKNIYKCGTDMLVFVLISTSFLSCLEGSFIFSKDLYLIVKEIRNNYYTLSTYVLSTLFFEYTRFLMFTIISYIIGFSVVETKLQVRFIVGLFFGIIICTSLSFAFTMIISICFCGNYASRLLSLIYWSMCLTSSGLLANNSNESSVRILDEINPLVYGVCLAMKLGIATSDHKYIDSVFLQRTYNVFSGPLVIIALSIGLFVIYTLLTLVIFYLKFG